jgi:hypothetical protein
MREALDPDQPGGSPIALPNDPVIRADLAAPRFTDTIHGIQIEEKAEIAKRLGRSPDAGDAIVMAWSEGMLAIRRGIKDRRPAPRVLLSPGARAQLGDYGRQSWGKPSFDGSYSIPSDTRGMSPARRRSLGLDRRPAGGERSIFFPGVPDDE